jgi:hypothetical protein
VCGKLIAIMSGKSEKKRCIGTFASQICVMEQAYRPPMSCAALTVNAHAVSHLPPGSELEQRLCSEQGEGSLVSSDSQSKAAM